MRSTPSSDQWLLGRRQLFMLPTRYGLMFALLLIALLLASINYSNGLAYGLTFLLAALAVVSMLYTHRNISGLRVTAGEPLPVFAGELAQFPVWLHNDTEHARLGIALRVDKHERSLHDLSPKQQRQTMLSVVTHKRGYIGIPDFILSTDFPFGLLYSWSRRIHLAQRLLVYPKPQGQQALPNRAAGLTGADAGQQLEGDDFAGLREFRIGDAPQHISWKTVARGYGLYTKQFHGSKRQTLWLRWQDVSDQEREACLSQLCLWVLLAEQAGHRYGLQLPRATIAPARGTHHRHQCLKALALHD